MSKQTLIALCALTTMFFLPVCYSEDMVNQHIVIRNEAVVIKTPRIILEKSQAEDGVVNVFLQMSLDQQKKLLFTLSNTYSKDRKVTAEYLNNTLYIKKIYKKDLSLERSLWRYSSADAGEEIKNTKDLFDFRVSPDEEYLVIHTTPARSDGLFTVIDTKGNTILQLTNSDGGTEQPYDAKLIGWTNDSQFFFYKEGSSVSKVTANTWDKKTFFIAGMEDNGGERFNLDYGLVAHSSIPIEHGIDEEEIETIRKTTYDIYVTHIESGNKRLIAKKQGVNFTLEWLSEVELAIIDDESGEYEIKKIDLNALLLSNDQKG